MFLQCQQAYEKDSACGTAFGVTCTTGATGAGLAGAGNLARTSRMRSWTSRATREAGHVGWGTDSVPTTGWPDLALIARMRSTVSQAKASLRWTSAAERVLGGVVSQAGLAGNMIYQ